MWEAKLRGAPATRLGLPDNRLLATVGNMEMEWYDRGRNITPFTLNAGLELPRNFYVSNASLLSYFNMMMEDGMFSVIAEETNAYAALCQ